MVSKRKKNDTKVGQATLESDSTRQSNCNVLFGSCSNP